MNTFVKVKARTWLLYHFVCLIKYRRNVLSDGVSITFKKVCLELEERYDFHFLEIGIDGDHVHLLIQSIPMLAPKKIIRTVKSITAKEIFRFHREVNALGRKVLDQWVLCKYGWAVRK